MVAAWSDLEEHEFPPKHIWADGRQLKEWFQGVREKRKREYGSGDKTIEDPVENEAAKGLLVG